MIDVIKCNYFWNLHFLNARFSFACACVPPYHFVVIGFSAVFVSLTTNQCASEWDVKFYSAVWFFIFVFHLDRFWFSFLFFYLWFWFWFLVDRFDRSKMSHVSYANEQTHIAITTTTSNNSKRNFLFWNMETVLRDCATLVGSSPFKPHSLTFLHGSQFFFGFFFHFFSLCSKITTQCRFSYSIVLY